MPRVEFIEDNIKKNDYDYPKFKLDKKGEKARIAVLEAPVAEFVHNLRKPKLVNGVPQKETKTKRNGEQYEDYVYEFVSRPICLGDYGVLTEDGSDPDKCPLCAEAKRTDRFYAPQRRFALHVVHYETNNKLEVKEPFSARTEVYSFTDKVFGELYSFKQQGFNLQKHDIIVTAENPAFAGYNLQVTMEAEWLKSEERQAYIKGLFAEDNLAPDLSIFCGSKKSEKQIEYDIRAINEAWDIATGVRNVSAVDAALSTVGGSMSLVDSADDLLGRGNQGWAPSTSSDDDEPLSFDKLASDADDDSSESPAAGTSSIEDLLKNL
jgi:hypothetical protein